MRAAFGLIALLGACNVSDGSAPDAAKFPDGTSEPPRGMNFACAGHAWPTTAPDPLALTGKVESPVSALALGDVAVEIKNAADGTVLGTTTSSSGGAFAGTYSIAAVTGGTAVASVRKGTLAGRLDGYSYDPFPQFSLTTADVPLLLPTQAELDGLYGAAGQPIDAGDGTVQINVVDCTGAPVKGATVALGAVRVLYLNDQQAPDPAATKTSSTGVAILLGVPPGPADPTITVGTVSYRAWPAQSIAASYTLSPRYP